MKLRPDLDHRLHRPVLPADHDVPVLRRAEPGHQHALQPRPALDRPEGAEAYVKSSRRRRHRLLRPGGRVLRLRRREVVHRAAQHRLLRSTPPSCRSTAAKDYPEGNMGHRPGPKGGYFPVNPIDSAQDLRGEMLAVMGELGLEPEKHHHEVAPAQHELGLKFADLITMADRLQLYKYVIHNVAAAYGKTATFMAKPYVRRQRLGHARATSRSGTAASRCSPATSTPASRDICLWYIGGIIKHAKAINAFTNSTTNSYKRLVPGYEAPGEAGLLGPQPLGLDPHPARRQLAEGQAHRGPLPRPDGQPLPDLHRPADGRPRRHREQDRSGRGRWTRTSTTCRRASRRRSRRSAARCAKRSTTSTRTAPS